MYCSALMGMHPSAPCCRRRWVRQLWLVLMRLRGALRACACACACACVRVCVCVCVCQKACVGLLQEKRAAQAAQKQAAQQAQAMQAAQLAAQQARQLVQQQAAARAERIAAELLAEESVALQAQAAAKSKKQRQKQRKQVRGSVAAWWFDELELTLLSAQDGNQQAACASERELASLSLQQMANEPAEQQLPAAAPAPADEVAHERCGADAEAAGFQPVPKRKGKGRRKQGSVPALRPSGVSCARADPRNCQMSIMLST